MDIAAGLWTFSILLTSKISYAESAFCSETSSNVTTWCPWGCCTGELCCAKPSTSYFWIFGVFGAAVICIIILYCFKKRCSKPVIVRTPRNMCERPRINVTYNSQSIADYNGIPPAYISPRICTNFPVFPADCDLPPPYELPPSYEDVRIENNNHEQR